MKQILIEREPRTSVRAELRWVVESPNSGRPRVLKHAARRFSAFSLIEMMIAIVILGLGLVMTATMFPVAWTRARTLTEFTTERSIADSAESTLETLLHAAGPSTRIVNNVVTGNLEQVSILSAGSLAGDMFYSPVLHTLAGLRLPENEIHRCVLVPSDSRVHALNMENILAIGGIVVSENPWLIERNDPWRLGGTVDVCEPNYPFSDHPGFLGTEFCANRNAPPPQRYGPSSFYSAQVAVGSRLDPPATRPPPDSASPDVQQRWIENLTARRFAWAVFHRLPRIVGPDVRTLTTNQKAAFAAQAASASGSSRIFDMYIVTLRRSRPSNRYAVQDPLSAPDPNDRSVVASPLGLPASQDVVLPVAWRVQIEIPLNGLKSKHAPDGDPNAPTGVPTEVQVPPSGLQGNADARAMLAAMFPSGARFVDEVNGQVYRVTGRRENASGDTAFLTLDREILFEDVDDGDLRNNRPSLDADEFVRTVWVYPPPVDRSVGGDKSREAIPVFDGSSPVVGIDVHTMSVLPPG